MAVTVTTHAVVRYVERIVGVDLTLIRKRCKTDSHIVRVLADEYGLDVDQVKREIATAFVAKAVRVLGSERRTCLPITGGRVVVVNGAVVTVHG